MQTPDAATLADQAWALADAGRFGEANTIFSQLCRIMPDDPEVWMMRGVTQMAIGDATEAGVFLLRAVELDPEYPDPYLHLARLAWARGDVPETIRYGDRAVALDADYVEAWLLLGHAQRAQNRLPEAVDRYQRALMTAPDLVEAQLSCAETLAMLGRVGEAETGFRKVLSLQPANNRAWRGLGYICVVGRDFAEAIRCYEQALQYNPGDAYAYNDLGTVWMSLDDHPKAEQCFRRALELTEEIPEAFANLGVVLQAKGNLPEAVRLCRRAVELKPDSASLHQKLATALEFMGEYDEALEHCNIAQKLDPGFLTLYGAKGRILIKKGDNQQCCDLLAPFMANGQATPELVIQYADASASLGRQDEAIRMLCGLLERSGMLSREQQQVHAALGRLYDKTKQYDLAFPHFKQSNALKIGSFDLKKHEHYISQVIATFSREFLAGAPRAQLASDLPVFIVGMPRSGTSLTEQILASHPKVFGAGELGDIHVLTRTCAERHAPVPYPQCMNLVTLPELNGAAIAYLDKLRGMGGSALRVVDKMPHNFLYLGLIQLLLPQARVIHVSRDRADTCFSIYTQDFTSAHAYAYDLANLGGYYRQYERLMAHWNAVLDMPILNIRYEELVDDQEAVSRKLLDFCGLEWDERVLRFYELERDVATASYDQVRQPLYKQSVQRWKHYERHLGPLLAALES